MPRDDHFTMAMLAVVKGYEGEAAWDSYGSMEKRDAMGDDARALRAAWPHIAAMTDREREHYLAGASPPTRQADASAQERA